MSKSKSGGKDRKPNGKGRRPKSELIRDEMGCTLIVSLPPVIPEVQNLIAHQTMQFVLNFMDGLNECLLPEDRVKVAEVIVDSM